MSLAAFCATLMLKSAGMVYNLAERIDNREYTDTLDETSRNETDRTISRLPRSDGRP